MSESTPHSDPDVTLLRGFIAGHVKRDHAEAALDSLEEQYEKLERMYAACHENALPLQEQLEAAQRDNGRLALEAATADQDWKRAEAEANKMRHALTQVRAECDLPDYIAEFVGEALNDSLTPSSPNVRKSWGPERMRHDPERLS